MYGHVNVYKLYIRVPCLSNVQDIQHIRHFLVENSVPRLEF